MMRVLHFVKFGLIFLVEFIVANYQVVKLVLTPSPRFRPGLIAVPLRARTDFEITSLANSITLTPGTIAVHVSDGRDTIIIHALNVPDDPQELRRSVTEVFEANILKWTRPRNAPGMRKERSADDQRIP